MRPLKYWQKTYLFTLILFLASLNIGIFALSYTSYRRTVTATEDACQSEAYYILRVFESDYETLVEGNSSANPMLLMQSYGTYYARQTIHLDFRSAEGATLYCSFPQAFSYPALNTMTHQIIEGNRYLILSAEACESRFILTYIKDISELDEEFNSIMLTFSMVSLLISSVLAIALFFVLRSLSAPLEKLRKTTVRIAGGDYTSKAEEVGNDEFAELAHSFNSMLDKINDQMNTLALNAEQKQLLVDNLAHELRTPLTSIHGYAEYMQKASLNQEEIFEATNFILADSERLQKVSEKLLDAAFIRNNEIKRETVDLVKLTEDTVCRLTGKATMRKIALQADASPATVWGDGVLLDVLLSNLIDNAIKACTERGAVIVTCLTEKDSAVITVTDNGRGMTEEQLLHITEPFYRTDKSRSRADGGAGLGLALCQRIADAHGASMTFTSAPGKGTTVRLNFTTS